MCLHFVSGGLGATPLRTSGVAPGLTPFAIQLAALAPEAFRKMSVNMEQFQSSSKLPAGCPGWCLLVPNRVSSGPGTKVGGNIRTLHGIPFGPAPTSSRYILVTY